MELIKYSDFSPTVGQDTLVKLIEASPLSFKRGAMGTFHFSAKKSLSHACSECRKFPFPEELCEPLPLVSEK